MNGVIIEGKIYTIEDFENIGYSKIISMITTWFQENHTQVSPDDRLLFEKVHISEVEPYATLKSIFENYVDDDLIEEAASELEIEGDSIWVPAFDDVYWEEEYEADAFDMFSDSIQRIYEMKPRAYLLGGDTKQQHFFQILYANIFTSFEAYMVRAFLNKIFESNETLELYLTNQKEFQFENPKLIDLLKGSEHIDQIMEQRKKDIKDELARASWHDLKKVSTRFNCVGIDLKLSSSGLYPIIQKRNDIVHRNGRTIHDQPVIIKDDDLNEAIAIACIIAHTIRAHELGFEDLTKTGEK